MRRRSPPSLLASAAFACALAFAAPSSVHADGDDTPFTNLIALVSQRLALAEPVARWKWAHHEPITDAPREEALLKHVEEKAGAAQVDPEFARQFFRDQIEASKDVQNALFANWRALKAAPEEAPPDLAKDTRPKLDRLTQSLVSALAHVEPIRHAEDCPVRLAESVARWKHLTRYNSSMNAPLMRALSHVCASGGVGAVG
ncbi:MULTISPECIES: chorismate mutase [Caballeronia]|jgi:chorismate mutase|uniref:chorismate mutase n=1 Tax=Caballeronia TaxID=1827195 RepID=UPI00025BC984|nr:MULTISPECIES: chorismate mutase [Caballeronia]EKS68410.1 chorismate mutase [Burkholderia sp. SJ98]MCG7402670.1 chorismate mutase [Caballeronia zhejiangensis]MCI1044205.1 chorismate mutase [Caballeronia zhejiangensis]MDR5764506.1 chorismate mutase [Caballeronia sp. LZ028]